MEGEVELEKGSHVRVLTSESDKDKTDEKMVWVDYPSLPQVSKKGDKIFIDDGLIGLKVLETGNTHKVEFNKHFCIAYLLFYLYIIITYHYLIAV